MYYVTLLSNFAKGYDKYSNQFYKFNESKFKDKFFLLYKKELSIGIEKNLILLKKINKKDSLIIIETKTNLPLYKDHQSKLGQYIKDDKILVKQVYLTNLNTPISIEDLMSLSLSLNPLNSYQDLVPRSFSFLPIAKGCQARCKFCFSESSISSDFTGKSHELNTLEKYADLAKEKGASRAVITGGGEPTLLKQDVLLNSIKILKKYYAKIVLITNGYVYSQMDEIALKNTLIKLSKAGLNVLNISRHHYDLEVNKKIMNLNIPSERIFAIIKKYNIPLQGRYTCVLQKEGINSSSEILNYIDFAKKYVDQICFKELYISTSNESYYHNKISNLYSRANQIPLSLLTKTLEMNSYTKKDQLPWGSPVYNKDGINIAAYTEPSVMWERVHKIARSWNLMSNGEVFASLEDLGSKI